MYTIEMLQKALKYIHMETENGADRTTDKDILSQTEDGVPIRKLFISNIAERTTYKELSKLFSKYGVIENCYLKRNPGKSSFAFITFSTIEGAIKARRDGSIKNINIHDRDLNVMPANSWHQPDSIKNRSYILAKDWNKSRKKSSIEEDNIDHMENYSDGPISILNDDCLMHIFFFLPIISKIRIERVCKRWRNVSQESWRSVKKLDLCSETWGTSQITSVLYTSNLREVLIRCGRFLTHLDFSLSFHCLNRTTLLLISKSCPNLQIIDVTALDITVSGMESLAQNCKNIQKLSLGCTSYRRHLFDKDLKNLFGANKNLKYLSLYACQISGHCLLFLPSDTLEELILNDCEEILSSYLADALTGLKNLKHLTIKDCTSFTNNMIEAIGKCTNLETLELQPYVVRQEQVKLQISRFVNLKFLRLQRAPTVNDEFLTILASQCKQLTYLDITACYHVTNTGLEAIATLPKLETLLINRLNQVTAIGLDHMCSIKHLECRHTSINDMGLTIFIYGATNLEILDLSGCIGITNATINSAIQATSSRSNNTILKVFVGGTRVNCDEIVRASPYLLIVNLDYSKFSVPSNAIYFEV